MDICISRSPEDTFALGEAWGRAVASGWVIGLTGDLGAGKTQLVKGIAHGLGIGRRVSSPTFALVNEYNSGRLPLFHLDLYRLDEPEQVTAAGLESYLSNPAGVAVVEWIERWLGRDENSSAVFPDRFRRVWIETVNATERRIRHEDSGH